MPGWSMNFSPYLPDGAAARLKAYVYRGEDRSPIYNYLWRPLCRNTVRFFPVWLAANVITVLALAVAVFNHVSLWWYMPKVALSLNDSAEATALLPVAEQAEVLRNGVAFGTARYDAFRAAIDASGAAVPPWVFIAAGVGLVLYQYLDNIDGHQARRTGTASPLGLLMDHGCDAFNTIVGSMSIATATGCGPTWKTWFVMSTAVVVFFCNTWEEYYRGALILPVFNGANEGVAVAASLYFYTASQGPAFWLQRLAVPAASVPTGVTAVLQSTVVPTGLTGEWVPLLELVTFDDDGTVGIMFNTALVLFMFLSGCFTVLGNVYEVWRAVQAPLKEGEEAHGRYGNTWLMRRFPFVHALTRLLPLAVMLVLGNVWFFTSTFGVFAAHPRIYCWTIGLLFTKLCIHLMVAHLTSTEFHPLRRTMIPFLYIAGHVCLTLYRRGVDTGVDGVVDERLVLFEFFALSTVTFLHLAVNVATETASALDVPVFSVPAAKQRATLEREAAERKAANKRN